MDDQLREKLKAMELSVDLPQGLLHGGPITLGGLISARDIDEILALVTTATAQKLVEGRISEASWWTRNYKNSEYKELLENRLNKLKKGKS